MIRPCLLLLFLTGFILPSEAAPFLVKDGKAASEIIIAKDCPRMVTLAAKELQRGVELITGARLPILHQPGAENQIRIYVGRSEATDRLGIDDEGLRYGAYHIVPGPDHLVLLGHDFDFVPIEPWGSRRNDLKRAVAEWDKLTSEKTDSAWEFPMASLYRSFNRTTETWAHDEGGSLQAVYGFLRSLGVRWYMPGELGEVVPKLASISLPKEKVTVHPDFALRQFIGPAYSNAPEEAVLWGRRLGLNYGYELLGVGPKTHGLSRVHGRREMQQAHPDYYALIGGKRDFTTKGTGHACWSSAGLEREAVAYARTMFDHYGEPTLQLSPQDGLRMCRCENCAQLTPSNAVWGFLDRVARETAKTHPDRYLVGAAYTSYRAVPTGIDQLNSNIIVRINNVGRPQFRDPGHWKWYRELVDGWRSKAASGKIIRVENNYYDTVIHPRSIARDLREMKGISLGEMSEVAREYTDDRSGQTWGRPGTNHLNLYINASFLRDSGQDIEAVLEEYFRLFYGPAAGAMKAAFNYAENHYAIDGRARLLLSERVHVLELLHAARDVAGESIYRKRIQFIIDEFDPLDDLRKKLEATKKRGDVPAFQFWNLTSGKWKDDRAGAVIDGKLDERFWNTRGKLEGSIDVPTRFQILLAEDSLWVGIRCRDTDLPALRKEAAETGEDDESVVNGDRVEILLETDAHAFYRIAVSPDGGVYDADVSAESEEGKRWDANAEIAVGREDDGWTIEARIPLVTEAEGAGDPLHHVLYRRPPSNLWPWYFNLVRVRSRDGGEQISSFTPVVKDQLLDRFSFGKLAR